MCEAYAVYHFGISIRSITACILQSISAKGCLLSLYDQYYLTCVNYYKKTYTSTYLYIYNLDEIHCFNHLY